MTSDRLTDSLDRQWVPGPVLGRGTWGRSRLLVPAVQGQGRDAVLKEPLVEGDFPADAPLPDDLLAACRACARQQADLLHEASHPHLPRLDATIDLGGGRVGLVLPHYQTLDRRLHSGLAGGGITLGDVLKLAHRIAQILAESGTVHGNLRPSNILFGERGELFLADPATPALAAHHVRLIGTADARDWLPPEARTRPTTPTNSRLPGKPANALWARWDTWALCQIVHCAILANPHDDDVPADLQLAGGGLDKVALSSLKDAAHAKLAAEGSNPRFRSRVTDRLGALLARGLSTEFEPSPPYRFSTAKDLADRLNEVLALIRPRVVEVGKILLPPQAADGVFQHGADVAFTVTVGCTLGITDHEDLVCGLQLVDLDATEDARKPVEDAKLAVQVHPSGRLRFQLTLPDVPPGRYRVRVAFAVKDSGDEPQVANGDFEVRPAPGYVPPRPAPGPAAPLEFSARTDRSGGKPGIAGSAPPPLLRPAGATSAEGRTPEPTPRASREPTPVADARRTDPEPRRTDPEPRRTDLSSSGTPDPRSSPRGGELVGLFPRPVAPPDEDEDDRRVQPVRATPSREGSPVAATPRVTPVPLRASEDLTDATMPAPNHWPPPSSPPNPRSLQTGLDGALDESNEALDTEELLQDTDQWPPPAGDSRSNPRSSPGSGVRTPSEISTPRAFRDGIRPEFDLPLGGEDLPGFGTGPGSKGSVGDRTSDLARVNLNADRRRRLPLLERLVDLVRRDSYVAVGAAVAACLVIVLLSSAALRACE